VSDAATLVVGPSWVGDMVLAQSLFKLLKSRAPDAPVDVLAPAWSLPVVARMPEVREGIAAETGHGEFGLGKRRRIGRGLRGRYSRAIVLPRSFKSALIPWFARVPVRTGFRGEMRFGLLNDIRPFDAARLDQTIKRFLALGLPRDTALPAPPSPRLDVSPQRQAALVDQHGLATDRPVVALLPGAEFGPSKCWPAEHYAALARRLADDGYDVWLCGSPKDAPVAAHIARLVGPAPFLRDICGKTSLADAIDLLALAEQAVANDSGLMHIAAAVGVHVHGLYGPTSPAFVRPLTERADIHFLDLDCSPCRKRECPLLHHNCLRNLGPEAIHAAVLRRRP